MIINITDLSGHTFTIKLNWDIGAMKDSISIYYDTKFKNNFLLDNDITQNEFNTNRKHRLEWYNSHHYARTNDYNPANIQLIYKGEILEQFHVEADLITLNDLKEDNNINVIILKKDETDDDDNISNISSGTD